MNKHIIGKLKRYFSDGLKYLGILALMSTPLSAWADALPDSIDAGGSSDITTLWVVGDIDVIARGLNAVAMFFNGAGTGSPMVSLLILGAMLALVVMLTQFITKRTMDPANTFLMIVIVATLFIPKSPVWVSSYYDARGGAGAGAVGFRKVDNVPIGVAWPLGIFSNIAKKISEIYDSGMQVLPDTAATGSGTAVSEGGILTHGAEGYFSPLKKVLRLRNQFAAPENTLMLSNLANASQVCNWSDRWGDADKGGVFNVMARGRQTGMVRVALPAAKAGDPPVIGLVGCSDAGKIISLMMLKNVINLPGKNYSQTAVTATNTGNLSAVKGGHIPDAQRYEKAQTELDQLPQAMAAAAGGDTSRTADSMGVNNPDAMLNLVRSQIEQGQMQPTALAQLFTSANAVSAVEIEANMIFTNIVQSCIGSNDANCAKQAFMMSEARNRAAIDAAGEASLYQNFMGHAMNILMFIYIVMSPVIIFVILTMGWGGIRIMGSYLLFAAWINSWLPLNSAISFYMLQNYHNRMRDLVLSIASSDEPGRIYSPVVINGIFNSTQDMLASASTLMASTPLVMLSLLSGSIYGMVQLAQRMNMGGKDYLDENKAAPALDQSEVVGMARMLQNSSAGGTLGTQNFDQNVMSNADAANPATINLQTSQQAIDSARESITAKVQMMEGASETRTLAQIDSDGKVTQTGIVYTHTVDGKDVARIAHTGEHAVAANEKFALGISGDKVVGVGAKGEISDSVTYKDTQGNDHDLTQGTSIGTTESIQTSFGTMNSHQLSSSISQSLSDAREQARSIEQATSDSVSHGFSSNINRTGFASLVSNDAVLAQQQLSAGAVAAGQYDSAAGSALQAVSGNSSAYFSTLMGLSTGTESERSAALAAIQGLAAANPASHAQAYANMAQGALAVQEQSRTIYADNQAAIDQRISSDHARQSGSFQNPLDNKGQLEMVNPQGHTASAFGDQRNDGTLSGNGQNQLERLTPAERQKILEYNRTKVAEMTEFNNSVMKEVNDRPALQKYFDYAQADAWKAWRSAGEQLDKGDYGGAAFGYLTSGLEAASLGTGRLIREAMGTQETSSTGLSDTNDPALNAKIRQVEANQKMMSGFNMSDTSKTIDGKPIEEIIGRNPEVPTPAATGTFTTSTSTSLTSHAAFSSHSFTPEKAAEIARVAKNIGANPNDLAAVISFETSGTFSTNARNPYSSGTGLIQFMDYTDGKKDGRYWGMSRNEFGKLSFEHQMRYVEKYFGDRGFSSDKPQNIANLYTAVSGYGYKIGSEAYAKNKVWDTNKNGVIEKGEMVQSAAFKTHRRLYFKPKE